MCRLVNLSGVESYQNRFSGPIPPDIANCKWLQRLPLANNNFTSELPKEMGNLLELVTSNILSHLLTGQISPAIVNCEMLQRLDLCRGNFVDALPKQVGTLLQLELLKVSKNKFFGNMPTTLGTSLIWLNADRQKLFLSFLKWLPWDQQFLRFSLWRWFCCWWKDSILSLSC